jgi:hypothetical protein
MNTPESTPLAVHVRRIYGEYLEMPGLRLTCAQAQRLWGLDATACVDALQTLTNAGFLRRTDAGQYVRLTDGAVRVCPLRPAKAELRRPATSRFAV